MNQLMIDTGKKHGITTQNSIVTRYMQCAAYPKSSTILDFGSGYLARQSQAMQKKFPLIRAYDFPIVITESIRAQPNLALIFDTSPFRIQPDIVLLSNVLNVQPSMAKVKEIINSVYCNLPIGSKMVFNLPHDPIKIASVQSAGDFRTKVLSEMEKRFGQDNIIPIKSACNLPVKYLYEAEKKVNSAQFCANSK